MALHTMIFAVALLLAWIAWIVMMAGVAAVTKDINDIDDSLSSFGRRLAQFASSGTTVADVVASATALSWTIVWLLFLLLVTSTVALVVARNNLHLFKKFARFFLFFVAVILGWMGNDAHDVANAERNSNSSAYSALLAGYILMFLDLFGMAIAALIALNTDSVSPEGSQQGAAASGGAPKPQDYVHSSGVYASGSQPVYEQGSQPVYEQGAQPTHVQSPQPAAEPV